MELEESKGVFTAFQESPQDHGVDLTEEEEDEEVEERLHEDWGEPPEEWSEVVMTSISCWYEHSRDLFVLSSTILI